VNELTFVIVQTALLDDDAANAVGVPS